MNKLLNKVDRWLTRHQEAAVLTVAMLIVAVMIWVWCGYVIGVRI